MAAMDLIMEKPFGARQLRGEWLMRAILAEIWRISSSFICGQEKAQESRCTFLGSRRGLPVNVVMQASIRPSTSRVSPRVMRWSACHARAR